MAWGRVERRIMAVEKVSSVEEKAKGQKAALEQCIRSELDPDIIHQRRRVGIRFYWKFSLEGLRLH